MGYSRLSGGAVGEADHSGDLRLCAGEWCEIYPPCVLRSVRGAEEYFDYIYDCSVDVTKGYEFKIKLQANDDGDKDTTTQRICVVKVKGEGWKVITTEASYLKDYAD